MKVFVVIIFLAIQVLAKDDHPNKKFVKYEYLLWIGDDIHQSYSINLKSPSGSVFFNAMEQAAKKDDHFKFEFKLFPPYGRYITSISGVSEDSTK